MSLVLTQAECALIFRSRLEAELAGCKGPLARNVALDAASKLFSTFDVEPSLARFSTAALVAELRERKAAAEAEAA